MVLRIPQRKEIGYSLLSPTLIRPEQMSKFDRELQKLILEKAIDAHPDATDAKQFHELLMTRFDSDEEKKVRANIIYLVEHKIITIDYNQHSNYNNLSSYQLINSIRATEKGIDFMLDDGGLSAILNVTTIKFHHDAIQQIADLIELTVQDPEDKQRFLTQLKQLPYETIKHVSLELVNKGLAQIPNVAQWLGKFLD
ncbi:MULTISPECIES: hypothetical protein [Xenorhabdus]|uniref:hypothetical protein n=1 Tax=Xenorhabdus TaxID=626 RepID=UPI00064ABD39|nr:MULTISPECIES: hypothetical protein [Xenorhabdus]KLU13888.1 hypothetical protein AAY47_19635 [Xenorhabdus griffiniae]KOP35044.1 hypothetical protein AFK69_01270 [Xenorhabdus sp. GDc328]